MYKTVFNMTIVHMKMAITYLKRSCDQQWRVPGTFKEVKKPYKKQSKKILLKELNVLSLHDNTTTKTVHKSIKSISTQWRNEIAPRKSKKLPTSVIAASPVSQYRQANRIFASNSCLIFYVCVFLMDLKHALYVWESPFIVFDKLDLPLLTECEDSSLSQRAILGTQVWLWGSQT